MAIINEAIVNFKAPKRMKKRRQLDALVDTVKLPRNRKNSTSRELLNENSDSSEVEEFSLAGLHSRSANRCCLCQGIVLRIGLFMVTVACLSICFGLVWVQWHLRHEIKMLQEKMQTVQSPEEGKNDLTLLQTQVKELESSLQELKKSDGILEHMKSTVKEIGGKLRNVEATTMKLNQSVTDAQSLLDTPKNLKSLSGIVASLGSDFNLFKEEKVTQSAKINELEQRISVLEANQLERGQAPPEKKVSMDPQFIDVLSQQIADVNETSEAGIISTNEQISEIQGRLSALEMYEQSKGQTLGHDEVETLVTALIQEKLNNLSAPTVAVSSSQTANGSSEELSQLVTKVNRLTEIMEAKTEFAESMDLVGKGDFIIFQGDAEMKFETINKTLFALSTELDAFLQRLDSIDSAVIKIGAAVTNSSTSTIDQAPQPVSARASTTVASDDTVASVDEMAANVDQPVGDSKVTGTTEQSVDHSNQLEASSSEISEEIDQALNQEPQQGLHIKGIETAEDLHKAFLEVWPLSDGQIDADFVLSQLTNNSTDIAKTLKTFDTNSDNFFSEEELQKALGLQDTRVPRR